MACFGLYSEVCNKQSFQRWQTPVFLLHPRTISSICESEETLWKLQASIRLSSSAFQLHLWAAPQLYRDRSVRWSCPDLGKAGNAMRGCSNLILRAAEHRFESFPSYLRQTRLQQVQQMLSSGRSQQGILRVVLPVWERIKIRSGATNSAAWLMTLLILLNMVSAAKHGAPSYPGRAASLPVRYQPAFKTKNVLPKKANAILQLGMSKLAYPHNLEFFSAN